MRLIDNNYPYHSPGYVKTLPRPAHQEVLYIKGVPSGLATFHTLLTNIDMFLPNGYLRSLISKARMIKPDFLHVNLLECGPGLISGNSLLFRTGLSGADEDDSTIQAIKKSLVLRKKQKADLIMFRDFTEENPIFSAYGFHKVPLIDLAVLDLDIKWSSFCEYTEALKSRYRSMVRRHRERLIGIEVKYTGDFSLYAGEMFSLWQKTNSRAAEYTRDDCIDKDYFNRLSLLEVSTANLFLKNGRLVAFNVMLEGTTELFPLWLGLDYQFRDEHSLLFNVYYKTIEAAILRGKSRVYFGETSYNLKTRLGCKLVPQYGYLYSPLPLMAKFLVKLSKHLVPEQKVKEKKVWKE